MADSKIRIPQAVMELVAAQKRVVEHYAWTGLRFTLDGRLVGDLGEAIALEHFELVPCDQRENGIDVRVPGSRRTVQIKASGTGHGPTFSKGVGTADLLLFLSLDFETGWATVAYNGPEEPVRRLLGDKELKHPRRLKLSDVSALSVPAGRHLGVVRKVVASSPPP